MSAPYIKVALFEDNKDLREGIRYVINATSGFTCVGAYANCHNLIDRLKKYRRDVALVENGSTAKAMY